MKSKNYDKGMQRRNFLKWGGTGLLSFPFLTKLKLAFGATPHCWGKNYWEGEEGSKYCVHRTIYDGEVDSGYIWARIDWWWRRFQIKEVEDTFWKWSLEARIKSFEDRIAGTHTPTAAGPHTPAVATYGNGIGRGDSFFHINNKVVGAHFVPKKDYVKKVNDDILEVVESGADYTSRLEHLKEIHEQDIWRKDMHVGVEYFSNTEFETHTFLNIMENPVAALCFQGCYDIYTSYELRCIPQIVHLNNPNISTDLYEIAKFPFMLMAIFHGDPPNAYNTIPAVIYYHIEEFDNSMDSHGEKLVKSTEQKLKSLFA